MFPSFSAPARDNIQLWWRLEVERIYFDSSQDNNDKRLTYNGQTVNRNETVISLENQINYF